MKQYKEGTQFTVCTVEYLTDVLGWWEEDEYYYHDNFIALSISPNMLKSIDKTLTVSKRTYGEDWYGVEENDYYWPVATFLDGSNIFSCSDGCKEGVTPINGWIICKVCGTDLKLIRKIVK